MDQSIVSISSSSPLPSTLVVTAGGTILTGLSVIRSGLSWFTILSGFSGLPPLPTIAPLASSALITITVFSALISLFLSLLPSFFGEIVALDVEGSVIPRVLPLLSSGLAGKCDLEDGQESLLPDGEETLLLGLININNLSFGHVDDLVKALYLSAHDLSDPERPIHKPLSRLDGHKTLAFTEEKSESPGDVFA